LEDLEAQSACLLGQAGIAVRESKWEQAEELLGGALTVAEGRSVGAHTCVLLFIQASIVMRYALIGQGFVLLAMM